MTDLFEIIDFEKIDAARNLMPEEKVAEFGRNFLADVFKLAAESVRRDVARYRNRNRKKWPRKGSNKWVK